MSFDKIQSRESVANMLKVFANQKHGFKICHINAQSLRRKIEEFRYIFENSNIDLICVSETWFNSNITDLSVSLNGYNLRRVDRDDGYGGVAMYIKKSIAFNIKFTSKENYAFDGTEDIGPVNMVEYLFVEVKSEGRKLLVGSIYRPNRNINIEQFLQTLETQTVIYDDVILAGDFNANLLEDSAFLNDFSCLGLQPSNTTIPTHFTQTSNTLLDIFFVSNKYNILLYDQLSVPCFSRHDLIFMTYKFQLVTPPRTIAFRDFKNMDMRLLERKFFGIEWNNIYYLNSVDDQLTFLEHHVNNLFDLVVPLKTKLISSRQKPWFSTEIKESMLQRDIAYNRWKRFKTLELREAYRTSKSKVNKLIRRAKSEFYAEKFSSALSTRKTWQTIREVGIGKTTTHEPCLIDADIMNEKFLNIPKVEADPHYYDNHPNSIAESTFSFVSVHECDVLASLLSIKSNSVGADGINPKFLKVLLPLLLPFITFIFNRILTSSKFPSNWKIARIVPVPKTSSEYRPIAILPFLSKVFERIMHKQMTRFLDRNNMITQAQSGFRRKHGCITALVDVAEDIRKQVDDGNTAFLVLLDHSKAFDTVEHNILCYKLKHFFNFSSAATQLLSTYLCKRYQYTETHNGKSRALPVSRGVPQGSIVGPLLFSMYSNDLPTILTDCKIRMYADDVQLYTSCNNATITHCVSLLNQQMHRIQTWASANGLAINPAKSKCIVIQKRLAQSMSIPDIYINDQKIQIVTSAKNLGIYFNKTLTWSDHVNYACGRSFSMLRTMWPSQYCTPIRIRILLAKTYLIPTLLYGCELFSSCDSSSKRKLNVAYNNIIRYVYGLNRRSRISMFSTRLYRISFDCLLKFKVLVLMHKIIYTRQPEHLYNRLSFADNCRGRRIRSFGYKSLISSWHFYIYATTLWNSIPYSCQVLSNARQFKTQLMKLFST